MSKLIHSSTLAAFKLAFPDWADTTSTAYKSIAYTDDGYMYTHGKVFQMSVYGSENPWGLSVGLAGQKLSVTVSGYTDDITLPIIGVSAADDLSVTSSAGIFNIIHKDKFSAAVNIGPAAASSDTISVPKLTVSKTGHITAASNITATLNRVKQNPNTTATTAYLLFGTRSTVGTEETQFNTNLKANLATGALYANTLYEGAVSLSAKYAPIGHAVAALTYGGGTGAVYGHVKLSDSIASTSGAGSSIAATPKAVVDSLNAAKAYAKDLLGTTDAMLFVGTINGTGVIQSYNTNVITQAITTGTTNISDLTKYSAGWTFKVTAAGTIAGIGKVEVGDMIICSTNYGTAYKATDWDAIQANIDGAVTIASNLVANALILGSSATTVKSLANGSNGQYLRINSAGVPTWTTVGIDMRAIKYNGAAFLASTVNTALDIKAGSGISLSAVASTGVLTVTNTGVLNTFALSINNGGTVLGSYQPKTAAATLRFEGGLKAAVASGVYTVSHTSTYPAKTSGLYKISTDAYGHVSAGDAVTSLPNTAALTIANNAGTAIDTYIGSTAKTIRFNSGTDIALTTTTASNVVTVTPSITHRYRPISFQPSGAASATVLYSNASAGTLTLKAGANMQIANAAGVLTLSSTDTNTWRNVKAIIAGTNSVAEVLSTSIGVADLEFGSDFLWTETGNNGKLQIGWAEIDADGNVTYVV